ncbi:urea ABC transporter ATP-binding subunit UrtE [Celerinatantimonas sp. MCCC 1A17872]|uniref:urea ABC transporter ATP-binding subunit UrtE n=1 Tax=Celerinatantimonas sp. MCCC 1A17872 TaxID=3177514 RepID=UPI0038CB6548
MIEIKNLNQRYGGTQILWDLNLSIPKGECTCIMGRNGVGKTTLLKCLMGLLPISSGTIELNGQPIERQSAEQRARLKVGYVPQGRDIFPLLSVEENLKVSLAAAGKRTIPERVYELFPVLKEMHARRGGDLSGGQQQQLAIGRALVLSPTVLILDEPNEGIQPNIVNQIGEVITHLNQQDGLTVVLVEQKLGFARKVGHQFRLMEKGHIVASDKMENLSDELIKQHLAV